MPETPSAPVVDGSGYGNEWGLHRSPSKRLGTGSGGGEGVEGTKTTEEKQGLLGRYLGREVDDLVEDLRESAPFGSAVG